MTLTAAHRYGAVDVHYPASGGACAALIVSGDERFERLLERRTARLPIVEAYEPGRFYLRELPAIVAVLSTADDLDLLIVDGYVDLDPNGKPGLGARLHDLVNLPIIGVAKTAFRAATHAIPVVRGEARKPLYVTAASLPVHRAAALVGAMAGRYRLPDALREVDRLARASPVPDNVPRPGSTFKTV